MSWQQITKQNVFKDTTNFLLFLLVKLHWVLGLSGSSHDILETSRGMKDGSQYNDGFAYIHIRHRHYILIAPTFIA